ncbi:MAG: IS1595 family transposase [Armatimonadetes bacterium]|nr:IS1595 family transposase [Armatimonadota bacterium]
MAKTKQPETLLEVVSYFADERRAFEYIRDRRWPDGVSCPRCGSEKVKLIETRSVWRCNGCRRQFSVKVGTIFEDSPIKLGKWLPAMWLIANCKNGISSYELAGDLGVTQKTAWFMLHRIRLSMQSGSFLLKGHVEADETYIGGKARNMHRSERQRLHSKGGGVGKTIVLGMLERGGKVATTIIMRNDRRTMNREITRRVHGHSTLFTDAHKGYDGLEFFYQRMVIDHAVSYVEGNVHTNGLENYWSLLKRTINGTYVSVEPFHLHRYLDEQAFRFNARERTNFERFDKTVSGVIGKRLTYNDLTGKHLTNPVAQA